MTGTRIPALGGSLTLPLGDRRAMPPRRGAPLAEASASGNMRAGLNEVPCKLGHPGA